jgi:hypothetical protein
MTTTLILALADWDSQLCYRLAAWMGLLQDCPDGQSWHNIWVLVARKSLHLVVCSRQNRILQQPRII